MYTEGLRSFGKFIAWHRKIGMSIIEGDDVSISPFCSKAWR